MVVVVVTGGGGRGDESVGGGGEVAVGIKGKRGCKDVVRGVG